MTADVFQIVSGEETDLIEEARKKYGTDDIVLMRHPVFPTGKAVRRREDILKGAPGIVRERLGSPAPPSSVRGTSFTFWAVRVTDGEGGLRNYEFSLGSYIPPK